MNYYNEQLFQQEKEMQLQLNAEAYRKSMDFYFYADKEALKKNLELEKMRNALALKEEYEIRKECQFVEVRKDFNCRICYSIVRDPQHPGKMQPIIEEEFCSVKKYRVIYPEIQELLVITFRKKGRLMDVQVSSSGALNESILLAKQLERSGISLKVSRRMYCEVCDKLLAYLREEAEEFIVPLKPGYTLLENGEWHLALPDELTMEGIRNDDY